jgi:hypothetical protein
LLKTASTIYGVAAATYPLLFRENASCSASEQSAQGLCPLGWTYADGACFRLFGDGKGTCADPGKVCCDVGASVACADGYTVVGHPLRLDSCFDGDKTCGEYAYGARLGTVSSDDPSFDHCQSIFRPNFRCEWTGPPRSPTEEAEARMQQPLSWAQAEEACQQWLAGSHLASVTSMAQQAAVEQLIGHRPPGGQQILPVWIGLNDFAEEGTFVWSDDEPLEYSNLSPLSHAVTGEPCGAGNTYPRLDNCGDGVAVCRNGRPWCPPHNGAMIWIDTLQMTPSPYICKRKTTPAVATGGEMLGCVGGRWVLGTPYRSPKSMIRLPPTIVSSSHSIWVLVCVGFVCVVYRASVRQFGVHPRGKMVVR